MILRGGSSGEKNITVLYTTQCLDSGSVLVHPVQWPKATELVHSRMCSKKLTLASWTGLLGHHSGLRLCDGQRGSDTGHDLGLSIYSPPTSGLGALSPTLSSVGGCPCVCAGSPHCECAG